MEFAENENKILKFWQKNKIFEKLKEKNKGKERWSFLDGLLQLTTQWACITPGGELIKICFKGTRPLRVLI